MNKLAIIIFFAGLLTLLTTCSKSPECWGNDKNKGIINNSVDIRCEPSGGEQFIVTNDSIYRLTFSTSCTLPTIDFNSKTLLGLYADGGCELKFIREVSQLDSENKYHYKVIVKSCGACQSLGYSYNWVTVPKLPSGWTVTFEVIEK